MSYDFVNDVATDTMFCATREKPHNSYVYIRIKIYNNI